MKDVNLETIDFMPLLKQQLITYVSINYEQAANYSNHSLVQEYNYLKRNDLLEYLPYGEFLTNELRLKMEYDIN